MTPAGAEWPLIQNQSYSFLVKVPKPPPKPVSQDVDIQYTVGLPLPACFHSAFSFSPLSLTVVSACYYFYFPSLQQKQQKTTTPPHLFQELYPISVHSHAPLMLANDNIFFCLTFLLKCCEEIGLAMQDYHPCKGSCPPQHH